MLIASTLIYRETLNEMLGIKGKFSKSPGKSSDAALTPGIFEK